MLREREREVKLWRWRKQPLLRSPIVKPHIMKALSQCFISTHFFSVVTYILQNIKQPIALSFVYLFPGASTLNSHMHCIIMPNIFFHINSITNFNLFCLLFPQRFFLHQLVGFDHLVWSIFIFFKLFFQLSNLIICVFA